MKSRISYHHSQIRTWLQACALVPLKLVVSNAGAALGQHHRYQRHIPHLYLPSVPLPESEAGSLRRFAPPSSPRLKSHDRRFSGAAEDCIRIGVGDSKQGGMVLEGEGAEETAESRAVQALTAQAGAMEEMYLTMLSRLEKLAPVLSSEMVALTKVRKEVAALQDLIR